MHHWMRRLLPPILSERLQTRNHVPGTANGAECATYRQDYVEFVAARRNLGASDAEALVSRAEAQFAGGWRGDDYRHFTELALETFRPLHDETSDAELIRTYQFHGALDFLRMLGYGIPDAAEIDPVVRHLAGKPQVDIVDYGCGLAHRTIAVARILIKNGVKVRLTLVDIRRELHVDFLGFLCLKHGIEHEFLEVTAERLHPSLPPHDYCDNVSVLEHVREPLRVIENTHTALRPGGIFLAAIEDEIDEMMHISPNLQAVRDRLQALGYQQAGACCGVALLQKSLS